MPTFPRKTNAFPDKLVLRSRELIAHITPLTEKLGLELKWDDPIIEWEMAYESLPEF